MVEREAPIYKENVSRTKRNTVACHVQIATN